MRTAVVALLALASTIGRPASALNGRWQPPEIRPKQVAVAEVLALYRKGLGDPQAAYAQRVERYVLQSSDVRLESTVTYRGEDFVASTVIDGSDYQQGRYRDLRWRRTPAGLVRIVESDVQGDPLDRWPLALLPIDPSSCAVVGESARAPAAWVLEYRKPHGSPHWFYVDESSGRIVREVLRDGTQMTSIVFDDFRYVAGATRPYHWRATGAGGPLEVTVADVELKPIPASAVELPQFGTALTSLRDRSVVLPATFTRWNIFVKGSINGHRTDFVIDTGTTQIILDDSTARHLGIRSTLGHAMVKDLSVGSIRFANASVLTVPLGGTGLSAILGYDFFVGHVVHINYHTQSVEVIDRSQFTPPAMARVLPAWYGEGLPLVAASFGSDVADRFALDTGSPDLLLSMYLKEHRGFSLDRIMARPYGILEMRFLEGPVFVQQTRVPLMRVGTIAIKDFPAYVELTNAGEALELPFDGIIGERILSRFEWWFDYDGDYLWFQPA